MINIKCDICNKYIIKRNYNAHLKYCKRFQENKCVIIEKYKKGISARKLSRIYKIGELKLQILFKSLGIHRNKNYALKLNAKLNPRILSEETKNKISISRKNT